MVMLMMQWNIEPHTSAQHLSYNAVQLFCSVCPRQTARSLARIFRRSRSYVGLSGFRDLASLVTEALDREGRRSPCAEPLGE
jgi:hypothetical protein